MSFSFQMQRDLQFDHTEEVLKIADDHTPELFHTPKTKVHFVKCVKDPAKLGGWGCTAGGNRLGTCLWKGRQSDTGFW